MEEHEEIAKAYADLEAEMQRTEDRKIDHQEDLILAFITGALWIALIASIVFVMRSV